MSIKPAHENLTAPTIPAHRSEVDSPRASYGARSLAVLRIAAGLVFLWPFADKLFGLGYSTPAAGAWIHGGSPTRGFLSSVDVGLALVAGAGLRIAAVSGTALMLLMWAAEWPLARTTGAGAPTHSTNPILDYHLVYALVLIVLAAACAGDTWGIGRRWAAFAGDRTWLR
jgi:thiosulfate dehydrogenase [quinone] large subunit